MSTAGSSQGIRNRTHPKFWACSHYQEQWIYMASLLPPIIWQVCCHLVFQKPSIIVLVVCIIIIWSTCSVVKNTTTRTCIKRGKDHWRQKSGICLVKAQTCACGMRFKSTMGPVTLNSFSLLKVLLEKVLMSDSVVFTLYLTYPYLCSNGDGSIPVGSWNEKG